MYLTIYHSFLNDKNPTYISKKYDISKQNLQFYLKNCKKKGLIEKIGYGTWELTKKGKVKSNWKFKTSKSFSLGTSHTNLHALQIRFNILEGVITKKDWEVKEELKNWIPRYKTLDKLGGMTLKNNNNKSLTVFAKSRDITTLEEVDNLAFKIRLFIGDFFRKQNVILDIYDAEVKNIHLETEDKNMEPVVRRKEQFTLNLNKEAEKIFEKDKIPAKAWIDPTPQPFSVGTNDKEWKRAYLSMPFGMQRLESTLGNMLVPAIQNLSENMNTHVGVLKEIKEGIREFREEIKNLNYPSITHLDSIKPLIKTKADIFKLGNKIKQLSKEDKEQLSLWILEKFQ